MTNIQVQGIILSTSIFITIVGIIGLCIIEYWHKLYAFEDFFAICAVIIGFFTILFAMLFIGSIIGGIALHIIHGFVVLILCIIIGGGMIAQCMKG